MRKKLLYTAIALLALLSSCGEEKEHRYMVICNNRQDTLEVIAKYWRTVVVSKIPPIEGVKSVTEFTSDYGNSSIYNVDCIIAKDSTNNN